MDLYENYMEIIWIYNDLYGFIWIYMELMRFTCGILWDVMGFSEIVMVICGNLANNNCGINRDLSISVRYGWAFRTRVLKTRVPERAF